MPAARMSFAMGVLAALLLCSGTSNAETLTQTVTSAIQHFPEIQSAQHRQEAVRAQAGQARAEFFPNVNTSLGLGRERSRNVSTRAVGDDVTLPRREAEITVSQLLFDGGVASGQVRRFNALAEGAGLTVFDTAETVGLRAGQAYSEVRRLREQLGIARENVTVHQRTLSDVTQIADAGRGRRADVVQAEARQALAISSAEQIAGELAQTEAAYKHLVGRPPGTLEPIPPLVARVPTRLDDAVSAALARHPAVLAAEKELQAAQHDQDSARARMTTPRVTVEAGSSRNRDIDGIAGPNQDAFAMLRFRYNLFRGFGDSERVRETAARVDQAVFEVARVRNEVERDVRQAWETLVSDRVRLPQLESYARASADVAEAYRLQFQLGQRSLLDVLNAENERFNATAGAVAGRASVAFGELRLLASMGILLESLGVSVPERKSAQVPDAEPGTDALGARSLP
jgi:adhesin transport system outer membrane protein